MRVRCPCGQVLLVDDALTGWRVRCPACQGVLRLPPAPSRPSDSSPSSPSSHSSHSSPSAPPSHSSHSSYSSPSPGSSRPSAARPAADPAPPARLGRTAALVAGIGAFLLLLMLLFGARATTVVLTALCLALALQGLWLGAIRVAAIVAGMLIALLIAPPIGGALAGAVRSVFGVPRLLSGLVGTGIVAVILVITAAAVAGPIGKRLIQRRRLGTHLNRWLGCALGATEGVFLSLMIVWALAILRPVAEVAQRTVEARGEPHPVAKAVVAAADDAQGSLFGRAAAGLNPLNEVAAVRLTAELAETATDERALNAFAADPAIKPLFDEPPVKSALDRLRQDKELTALVEKRDLKALLDHPLICDLAQDPDLRRLVISHQTDLIAALQRARSTTRPSPP